MFKRVTLTACLLSLTTRAYQGPIAGGQPSALYPAGLDPKSCPNFPVCTNHGMSTVKGFQRHESSTTYETSQIYQPQRPAYQLRYTSTPLVQLRKYSQPEYKYVPSSRPQQYSSPQSVARPTQQHNSRQQSAPPQQYTTSQEYTGPQQFTPVQQYAPPQKYALPQQYAPPQKYATPQKNIQSFSDDQYTPEQKRALDRGEYIGDGDYHGEGLAEALAPEYHQGFRSIIYIPTNIRFVKEDPKIPSTPVDTTNIQKMDKINHKPIETENSNKTEEMQARIETAKSDLMKMRPLLCNKNVSMESRTRMVKYYVSTTLFHGIKNRTLTQDDMRQLEAFEEWIYKKIFNISWTERIHNIEIFDRMGEGLEITKTVKTKEIRCQGYVYHRKGAKYLLVDIAMDDKMQGRMRIAGKRKTSWLRNLREMFGCTSIELYMEDEKLKKAVD